MFSTQKDFALLARQVAISPRGPTAATTTNDKGSLLVDIYQVRLYKLFHKPENETIEAIAKTFQCNPQELLHTVVALYDNALPEIGGETIYNTICEPKVVTLLIVNDNPTTNAKSTNISAVITNENDCLDTLLENVEYPDSVFNQVFSDESSDSSDEDESNGSDDSSNEHDYSIGVGKFLEKIKAGKLNFPKRLIGCLSFQKTTLFPLPTQEEHVIDLQLVACRKKYRGRGLGRHLLRYIMNRDYVGEYDAIVTASDQDAIDFYRKFGFTEDAIMLSKYKNIGDCWTNTTKMCYLPPYNAFNEDPVRCLTMMDDQFQKWQKTMFCSYQNQASLFNRLKNEMIGLYAKLSTQEQMITTLNRERTLLAKENATLKLKLSQAAAQETNGTDSDLLDTQQLIRDMQKMSMINEKILVAQMSLLMDDDCNTQMAAQYCSHKMNNSENFHIKAKKISNSSATLALYQSALASLRSGSYKNETLLFYSGHNDHLDIIAHAGFTNDDFLYGSLGKGLYFRSTLKTLQKQKLGKVLLCKVALGRIELMSKSKVSSTITLKRNSDYDSIKILEVEMNNDSDGDEEVAVFDSHLALPLFSISFE